MVAVRSPSHLRSVLLMYCLFFAVVSFVLYALFLSSRLPESHLSDHILQSLSAHWSSETIATLPHNSEHRIAILLPYASPGGETVNAATILSYIPVFCVGAAGAADIADFFIFHAGLLDQWPLIKTECPANVKFVHVGSYENLAERLLRVVDDTYDGSHGDGDDKPKMDRDELLGLVTSYVKINPYGLVEFKPALGHIFQDYISNYTHWGYSDIDILFGDLGRWITPDELTDYDIVTYSFGDQERLYLRGQFTFHKNKPDTVNQLWRECAYLTAMDERFRRLVQHTSSYHVESAEGCYSAAVMDRNDISVKFAVKAWTDIYSDDTVYSHGVFLSRSHNTGRQLLYKAIPERIEESGKQVSRLQPDWFEVEDAVYKNRNNPIQLQVGERERIELEVNPEAHCMYWALPKYQSKLCLKADIVASDETIFWVNGKLFKQRYENAILKTPVATAPFFHFQEWKRSYQYGQLASLYLSSSIRTFLLTPDGAIPMIEGKNSPQPKVASPLGLSPLKTWTAIGNSDFSQLPGKTYCILSSVDASGKRVNCDKTVSWSNYTTILVAAPGWKTVDVDLDVTLVLTLQITASQAKNQRALQNVLGHLKISLQRWHGQPSVVVVAVSGTTTEATEFLRDELDAESNSYLHSSLIAVVNEKSFTELSRRALLNMAIDAVPTRWYLSGLELERGLSISANSAYFAHRTAASHNRLRGTVLLIPQFGLLGFDASRKSLSKEGGDDGNADTVISLEDLLLAKLKGKIRRLSSLENSCDGEGILEGADSLEIVEMVWWTDTHSISDFKKKRTKSSGDDIAKRIASIEELQQAILLLATGEQGEISLSCLDHSPILLTDNLGPHEGIRTSEIAREAEIFVGVRCFNGMRLKQLAILGYNFEVLAGAFAASSEVSRKAAQSGVVDGSNRCQVCSSFSEGQQDSILLPIATTEIKRVAKTAIMWAESVGVKQ